MAGVGVDVRDDGGRDNPWRLVWFGEIDSVAALLSDPDHAELLPTAMNEDGQTLLHCAILAGQVGGGRREGLCWLVVWVMGV
jgi:hypothetical protein